MLLYLSIRNLALIDRLEIDFEPGLTVLTGETGAGKSMLVGAVALLAGGRASADLVRTGADQASVEGIFEDASGTEIIVRRDLAGASGRSRAFINGTLVTTAALREEAGRLVDLHGQHEHQLLLNPATHLDLLDAYGGLQSERSRIAQAFSAWQRLRAEAGRLESTARERAARTEFVEFQLGELRRAALREGEDDELAAARRILANADKLQRLSADAYALLYEGDTAVLPTLSAVWKKVGELAAIDSQLDVHLALRDGIKSQLEDLAFFLRSYRAAADASPERLQQVEDRLALIERLKKKHGPALADVLRTRDDLERELEDQSGHDHRAAQLAESLDAARRQYVEMAQALTAGRRMAATTFTGELETSLADLAMGRSRCEVRFAEDRGEAGWTERGADGVELFLSPNPGEDLKPLARIASGGELSRIMLALKTLASTDEPGKTLIFDEVDAGIGGAVADIVGARLRALSSRAQVLCITHLPQVAAHGTSHYRVEKAVEEGRTVATLSRLSPREREAEIARMIAGADVSASVRASAREMLRRRGESK